MASMRQISHKQLVAWIVVSFVVFILTTIVVRYQYSQRPSLLLLTLYADLSSAAVIAVYLWGVGPLSRFIPPASAAVGTSSQNVKMPHDTSGQVPSPEQRLPPEQTTTEVGDDSR